MASTSSSYYIWTSCLVNNKHISSGVVPSFLSGGFLANSLAIINDALHQFFDLNTLLMSLVASWIARWKPNEKKTFGYYRAGKNDFITRYKTC